MTLNDLEPPEEGFFVNFSRFRPGTRILRVNCTEMAEIDLDTMRREIAKAFARFMSFAQISCLKVEFATQWINIQKSRFWMTTAVYVEI